MTTTARTFIIRELSEGEADQIVDVLQRVERAGHRIADVRHEGGVWRIFAYERRFRDDELVGVISYRRRATD